MSIESGTLAVIDRINPETERLEVLVGVQARGPWQNYLNFVGGKIENELPKDGAIREIHEETGIHLVPTQLRALGRILVVDARPKKTHTESIAVYGASVEPNTNITSNLHEIDCFWLDPTERNVLLSMPLDVRYWLPGVYDGSGELFTCRRSIDQSGGESVQLLEPTSRILSGTQPGNLSGVLRPLLPEMATS